MSYWPWIWHNLFDLNLKRVCLIFACSPQLLLIKVWSRDQQKKGHRVNKEGRELSKIGQMLFILLCQYCHVIHYTPLWSETYECLQTIATPKDTANCCCAAIVFTAPFCGSLANWHSNEGYIDTHWQYPSCGGYNFCFWLWSMILFFPSLILCFSCPLSPCLVCFNCLGLAVHGRCCVPSTAKEVASALFGAHIRAAKLSRAAKPTEDLPWPHFPLWQIFQALHKMTCNQSFMINFIWVILMKWSPLIYIFKQCII